MRPIAAQLSKRRQISERTANQSSARPGAHVTLGAAGSLRAWQPEPRSTPMTARAGLACHSPGPGAPAGPRLCADLTRGRQGHCSSDCRGLFQEPQVGPGSGAGWLAVPQTPACSLHACRSAPAASSWERQSRAGMQGTGQEQLRQMDRGDQRVLRTGPAAWWAGAVLPKVTAQLSTAGVGVAAQACQDGRRRRVPHPQVLARR